MSFFQETIAKLKEALSLDASLSVEGRENPNRHRNVAIVLGCIAEKLAGPRSFPLFTNDTLEYLIANLVRTDDRNAMLVCCPPTKFIFQSFSFGVPRIPSATRL